MTALAKAISRSNAVINTAFDRALVYKAGVTESLTGMGGGQSSLFAASKEDSQNRQRYGLFRGWLYAAINALANKAATQAVCLGRIAGTESGERRAIPTQKSQKTWREKSMPSWIQKKSAPAEKLEMITAGPLVELFDQPNPIQGRWQFVYMFVANLNLTGRAYIIADERNGRPIYYCLPSTWVTPVDGYNKFKVRDPKNQLQGGEDTILTRDQVAYCYLPNPADPLGAMPPTQAQIKSVQIDDKIQYCQDVFFDRAVSPSVIVTIGKDPHPEVAAGIRPRLNAQQRRQVIYAIEKSCGVQNYGAPAIVDGLIESITKLSATQNEIGWEKSEETIVNRILSAFSVHRFILGSSLNVGGYAQASIIQQLFFDRVNIFLEMLSIAMTTLANADKDQQDLLVWWEPAVAVDPQMRSNAISAARNRGDISKNEQRAELGFPPDESPGSDQTQPLTPTNAAIVLQIQSQVAAGAIGKDQAAMLYEKMFGMESSEATALAGTQTQEQQDRIALDDATQALRAAMVQFDPSSPPLIHSHS